MAPPPYDPLRVQHPYKKACGQIIAKGFSARGGAAARRRGGAAAQFAYLFR
jgi:hypothetical protein